MTKTKVKYVEENMHISPFKVLWHAATRLDFRQPVVVVGVDRDEGELYVASSDSGPSTNSILTRAMRFIKNG